MTDHNPRKTVSTTEALNQDEQAEWIKAHVRAILSQLQSRTPRPSNKAEQ